MAIKISAFQHIDDFKSEMDRFIRALKNSRVAIGFGEITTPGELAIRNTNLRLIEGINIPEKIWNKISQTARNLKINLEQFH
jgi:LDH2 family malate/lactate/ureidoglycolate dehydrogenase